MVRRESLPSSTTVSIPKSRKSSKGFCSSFPSASFVVMLGRRDETEMKVSYHICACMHVMTLKKKIHKIYLIGEIYIDPLLLSDLTVSLKEGKSGKFRAGNPATAHNFHNKSTRAVRNPVINTANGFLDVYFRPSSNNMMLTFTFVRSLRTYTEILVLITP